MALKIWNLVALIAGVAVVNPSSEMVHDFLCDEMQGMVLSSDLHLHPGSCGARLLMESVIVWVFLVKRAVSELC